MLVHAESFRLGVCRSCGAAVEWITPIRTDRPVAFNPPIVLARQLFEALETETAEVDVVRSVEHAVTCPQAAIGRQHAVRRAAESR